MTALHIRRHPTCSAYAVFREDVRLTGWQNMALAERSLDRMRAKETGKHRQRKCLCCGAVFVSEGPHHRLCNYHRATIGGLGREMAG
jgi:hypothetical protein